MNDRTEAQHRLDHGAEFPYDAPDAWWEMAEPKPLPATDWAHAAARGILADLTDRRGIKWSLQEIDEEVRAELVASLAEIIRAALAQQAEPVARECSDPMCACRGGPCAECEEGEREKEIEDLRSSLYFYQRRCEALQSWQSKMRDPERTIVCDILANGKTLDPAVAGNRYTTPQQAEPVQRKPLTDAEIDKLMQSIGLRCADEGNPLMSNHAEWQRRTIARAIERAHGIKEAK